MKERDHNIDFLRGIAVLWIVVIHTAFYSGELYLPGWFSNLTLLLDVPAFMLISGISFNYVNSVNKNIKSILSQWFKWCYFLIFYILIMFIFCNSRFNKSEILGWIFYAFPSQTPLYAVQGSLWFIKMYIRVTLLCTILICLNNNLTKNKKEQTRNLISIIILLFILFGYSSNAADNLILPKITSFYSIIYLIGYLSNNYKINLKQTITYCAINLVLLLIVFYSKHLSINSIQEIKSLLHMPYIFVAAFSIVIFWYLKDKLKIKETNKIIYIGKNAIFFYFAQGLSSSFIYIILRYMPSINVYLTFICMLIINIFMTCIIALFLEKSYSYLKNKIRLKRFKNYFLPIQK